MSLFAVWAALIFVVGGVGSSVPASAEEVAIAFTGQAYAALYPCACPSSPEGGLARRGAAIKKLRQQYPRLLVVEAGMSFASGPEDASTQNAPQDMRRTEMYMNALQSMGTDAFLVSSQEYVFGPEFLERFKDFPFVSTNAQGPGVVSIYKKWGSVTVGILGLTDALAKPRGAASWRAPQQVLGDEVRALRKKGAQCVVALSALSPEEDAALLKDVPGIDLVINGTSFYGSVDLKKTDKGTRWIETWWQARKVGVLVLDVSVRGVKSVKLDAVSLGPEVEDDSDVKAVVPACFQNADCKKISGMSARCQDSGTLQAQCSYTEAVAVPVTVIAPLTCRTCRVPEVLADLEKLLGRVKPEILREDDPRARELIKAFQIKMLPAYFTGTDIEKHESFPAMSAMMDKAGVHYMFKPQVAGVSYFIGRPRVAKRWDIFFDFTYPALGDLFTRISEFQAISPDVDMRLHFLALWDQNGGFQLRPGSSPGDVEEFKRIACVNALFPESVLRYIACRSGKKDPALWEACAAEAGIDSSRVKGCAGSAQGEALLKERIALTRELEIATGPIFVIDNKEVFGIGGVPAIEELGRILEEGNPHKQEEERDL